MGAITVFDRWIIPPSKENFFRGYKVRVTHDPTTGQKKYYYIPSMPDGVQILAVTEDKKVIAIEEVRPGVGKYLHAVGETIEQDESATGAAERGLLEETGYEARDIVLLSRMRQDSAMEKTTYLFLATGCRVVREPEEGVRVVLSHPHEFWDSMMDYFENISMVVGGANTLKVMALAYRHLGWLNLTGG